MRPSVTSTRCSLIQALLTWRSVLVARAIPCRMASSKLSDEVELISVIRATDMEHLLFHSVSAEPMCTLPTSSPELAAVGHVQRPRRLATPCGRRATCHSDYTYPRSGATITPLGANRGGTTL